MLNETTLVTQSSGFTEKMESFFQTLASTTSEDELLDFCRKYTLHGTPAIFSDNEEDYYEFRKRIAIKFGINFHEIFITGSAKLGFSPFKQKEFDLDSDIDVAIVSHSLFDKIMSNIHTFQIELRCDRKAVSYGELARYHKFLEYGAMGWMRPDLLPTSFRIKEIKNDWFDFFDSISYGKSEVGNYKIAAGVFKSYHHLEIYTLSGLSTLKTRIKIGAINASSNKS